MPFVLTGFGVLGADNVIVKVAMLLYFVIINMQYQIRAVFVDR